MSENTSANRLAWATLLLLGALWVVHALMSLRFRLATALEPAALGYLVVTIGMLATLMLFILLAGAFRRELTSLAPRVVWVASTLVTLLVAFGTLARYRLMQTHAVSSDYGDMLPLIASACDALLNGSFPYTAHHVPWELPLTFPPGLWLPYLPFHAVGIELRWTGLLAVVALMALPLALRAAKGSTPTLATALGLLPLAIAPAWVDFTIQGHTQILWLWTALFALFIVLERPRVAALFLGILLASRQTMLVAVLPFALWVLHTRGWREWIPCALAGGLPLALLIGPFALVDADAVLFEPLRHYGRLAEYERMRGSTGYLAETLGFAYLFNSLSIHGLLAPIRVAIMAGMGAVAWRFARTPAGLLVLLGIGGFLFNAFTPIPWFYIYAPSFVLLAFSLAATSRPAQAPERPLDTP